MVSYLMCFSRKSTPMVFLYPSVKVPLQNLWMRLDLPTPPLPTTTTFMARSKSSSAQPENSSMYTMALPRGLFVCVCLCMCVCLWPGESGSFLKNLLFYAGIALTRRSLCFAAAKLGNASTQCVTFDCVSPPCLLENIIFPAYSLPLSPALVLASFFCPCLCTGQLFRTKSVPSFSVECCCGSLSVCFSPLFVYLSLSLSVQ